MDQEQEGFNRRVREELARRRMTRQRLAFDARISVSTLEKALSGERALTLATRLRVEEVLGIGSGSDGRAAPIASGVAPPDLGAYSRAAVSWLEGDYLTLRPSFGKEGAVFAYRTQIGWDEAASCLAFAESERLDAAYAQKGRVSLPHQSGLVYLVTNVGGQHRLSMLDRPGIDGALNGLLLTLQSRRGGQLLPVATSLALAPLRNPEEAVFGLIEAGHPMHEAYRGRLDAVVAEEFARFFV